MLSSVKKYPVPKAIRELSKRFREGGYSLYLVGGAVRDYLLGTANHDYDFTTDALPEEVISLFEGHTIPTGLKHGTVTVRFKGEGYEVTTFRTESGYSDSRHPDKVEFVRSLSEDLRRRDFTINAFAVNTEDGDIIDLHEGYKDLKSRTIRAIGNPEERFHEDALRMLRACRFAAKLDFQIEPLTLEAIRDNSPSITNVSAERVREELVRTLMSAHPAKGLELMRVSGLMHYILPELEECYGVEQPGFHDKDVYHHILATVQASADEGYGEEVRLAALLHDIAKPECRSYSEERGRYTFFGHEVKGAEAAERIMRRLRFSNEETETVSLLVREHMFAYSPEWNDAAVRRFILRAGIANIKPLFELRMCDRKGTDGVMSFEPLRELDERIRCELDKESALTIKDLAIGGRDMMSIGLKGPQIGRTLAYLLDNVIEDPQLNSKEKLLALAMRYKDNLSTL